MQNQTQRASRGRHRKFTASKTAKGRIALVAAATGAVSTAGVGGAAAAQLNEAPQNGTTVDYELTTDAETLSPAPEAAPQILNIAEYKPVANLEEQLSTAVQYHTERTETQFAAHAAEAAQVVDGAFAETQNGGVAKPAEGAFTSGFGPRWGAFHAGIDIANAVGTPILAVMDGTVIDSGPASGYGQWIRIKHDDGSISVYGHMVTLDVGVGERVAAGQKIAGMGSLGFSTGSHLHFEILPDGSSAVDPVPWFAERGITIA